MINFKRERFNFYQDSNFLFLFLFSLSTFFIRSTCYTSLYTFTPWKTVQQLFIKSHGSVRFSPLPQLNRRRPNFPSDKLFPELWHSIHGAESCESYYARKTCSKSKRLSSNIYALLSTFGVIKTRAWITDTQIIKRSSKPASLVCKE